jgi:AAA+ ATPase superfamily predicted ATPase
MKFYNRKNEIKLLKNADSHKDKRAIFTMIIGRRRVGKTALSLQATKNIKTLYFFVAKKNEALLCEEFVLEVTSKLNIPIFGTINKFEQLFAYLLEISKTTPFTLIIDEFQEFLKINPSIYSSIQKLWDINKDNAKLHLIACGSIYSLMKKIFEDKNEPLFGRLDFKIDLKPLKVEVLKEILEDYNSYSNQNLLDFYIFTGGIAKYIELLVLYEAFDFDKIIDTIFSSNSLFLDEGKNRLIEEFGKEYGIYFSILSLIASSKTSKKEIESVLQKNISGHLYRLENDYNIIKSIKPIFAKPNSKVQKYEIVDNFLLFWFRFIYKYQSLIELENFEKLKIIVYRDFSTFSGKLLEKLHIEILKSTNKYTEIGSYWERGNLNEIDIVAIDSINKELLLCEVKINPKKLNKQKLILKSVNLIKNYNDYEIEYRLLSLDDLKCYH